MVVVPNRCLFLCTPRTGSRAIVNALKTLPGASESREHHVHPEDVKETAESLVKGSSRLPMVTVIRDPYEQVLSWFGHAVLRHAPEQHSAQSFANFIRERSVGWYFHDSLNPYLTLMDGVHASKFEKTNLQLTLSAIFGHLNSVHGTNDKAPKLTRVGGAFSPSRELLNETTTRLIRERFPKDIELWEALCERSTQ